MRMPDGTHRYATMLVAAFAILAMALTAPAAAADFTMRINHTFGINSFPDRGLQEFKKQVEQKRTSGSRCGSIPPARLGQEIEQYELLQTGSLEAALLGGQILSSVTPEYAMFEAPYLARPGAPAQGVGRRGRQGGERGTAQTQGDPGHRRVEPGRAQPRPVRKRSRRATCRA